MSLETRECPRCQSRVAAGVSFCVHCGAAIAKQGAVVRTVDSAARPGGRTPLSGSASGEGGNQRTMAQLNLVNGPAGKRLVAKLLDAVPAALLLGAASLLGSTLIGYEQVSATRAVLDLGMFFVVLGIGSLISLGYWIFLWGWEAKTGKSPGNLAMGLRTTGLDGIPAGWLAIFLRNLIIWLSGVLPILGFVLVMVSNLFDSNDHRQGWHDKAGRTLVFDVRAGRNPLDTGGINGPASFAPEPPPPALRRVASPIAGHRVSSPEEAPTGGPHVPQIDRLHSPPAPVQRIERVPTGRTAPLPDSGHPESGHPDDESERTVLTRSTRSGGVRLVFDDGRTIEVMGEALIGRNPEGPGPEEGQLISVEDQGRSVSKTHLQVRVEGANLWITDRNSTNGSAISRMEGRTPVVGGQSLLARPGDTVHFGDRTFRVEQP